MVMQLYTKSEQAIQREIKKWLEGIGAQVTKYNANGFGVIGHPDLFVSLPMPGFAFPIAVFIEVKTEKGRLSKEQKQKIAQLERDHHMVVVAKSIEDVREFLISNGVKL